MKRYKCKGFEIKKSKWPIFSLAYLKNVFSNLNLSLSAKHAKKNCSERTSIKKATNPKDGVRTAFRSILTSHRMNKAGRPMMINPKEVATNASVAMEKFR